MIIFCWLFGHQWCVADDGKGFGPWDRRQCKRCKKDKWLRMVRASQTNLWAPDHLKRLV